jgi:hypothetical protein
MLHLYGMSAYREGNIIDKGFTQLQVVDACSGLRYVMPHGAEPAPCLLVQGPSMEAGGPFHFIHTLAIFDNSFRIAVTGILYGRGRRKRGGRVLSRFFRLAHIIFCNTDAFT